MKKENRFFGAIHKLGGAVLQDLLGVLVSLSLGDRLALVHSGR